MLSLRSELRRKVLTYFYLNRSARNYVRQLAGALGVDSTNLSRELSQLEREGLLQAESEGKHLYYSLNPEYRHLRALFSMLAGSVGIAPSVSHSLQRIEGIEQAYLYGSFAKGEADASSDIDLLIIGNPNAAKLASEVSKLERSLRRELNYSTLTTAELKNRLAAHDPFLTEVWQGQRLPLIRNAVDA